MSTMRLALKLIVGLVLGILVVMGGYAAFQLRREVSLYAADVAPNRPRGRAFLATIQSVWRSDGEQRARELVEDAANVVTDVDVRWVRTDVGRDDPRAPHDLPTAQRSTTGGEILTVVQVGDDEMPRRSTYLPLAPNEPQLLELTESLDRELSFIRMSHAGLAGATALVVLVSGLITAALAVRFVGRPLRTLREYAGTLGEGGDFSRRLTLDQRDEIGELATEMNRLSERLQNANQRVAEALDARVAALDQLRHADRLATVGQLASGVAHELGTPLSVVAARTGLILDDPATPAATREHAQVTAEQTRRMTSIIRQLLDFSRRRTPQLERADLHRVVTRTIDLLTPMARRLHVAITIDTPDTPVWCRIDESQLQQAIANIVVNGIQAMPAGGVLRVRVEQAMTEPPAELHGARGLYPQVSIRDGGTGIATDHLPHIFEPFFTTKGVGEGTGLGLSVAHGIVAEHGGWIAVDSTPDHGTCFRVCLPPDVPAQDDTAVAS